MDGAVIYDVEGLRWLNLLLSRAGDCERGCGGWACNEWVLGRGAALRLGLRDCQEGGLLPNARISYQDAIRKGLLRGCGSPNSRKSKTFQRILNPCLVKIRMRARTQGGCSTLRVSPNVSSRVTTRGLALLSRSWTAKNKAGFMSSCGPGIVCAGETGRQGGESWRRSTSQSSPNIVMKS